MHTSILYALLPNYMHTNYCQFDCCHVLLTQNMENAEGFKKYSFPFFIDEENTLFN